MSSRYVSPVDPAMLVPGILSRISTTDSHKIAAAQKSSRKTPTPVDPAALVPGILSRLSITDSGHKISPRATSAGGFADPLAPNILSRLGVSDADHNLPSPIFQSSKKPGLEGGRNSPCHDLGYHTLIPPPRQDLPPTPVSMLRTSPFTTPTPPTWNLPDTPPACDPATFKGKRLPRSAFFDRLADDLILKIFSFLSTNQLCICARVCRRWYFLAWEPQLWTVITLTGERTHADRALKALVRLLCRHTNSLCLTVDKVVLNGCSRLTNKGISIIAKKCPELRVFEARACAKLTDAGVNELIASCLNLEKLDISGCSLVKSLQALDTGVDFRQLYLQFLDMTDCHTLEDCHIKCIVRSCPQLTHLYLRRCVQLTDVSIKYAASYCVQLREFSMSDCVQLTDFGLYELAKLGSNLRYLSVAKCDQISDAGVKQIARHCYKLRYLNVRGCEAVSDDSMGVIARSCPRLRSLDVGKCDVSDHGLKLLSEHCPNIRKLSVKSCDAITDQGIQFIAYYCRGLQQLNIQDCHVTIDGYRTVKKFCKRCIIEHTNPGFY